VSARPDLHHIRWRDHLSDRGFPVEQTAIVGRDPKLVEQVTGRLDNGRAALRGTAGGAVTGALADEFTRLLEQARTGGGRRPPEV
jgi:hypothetical protein